MRIDLNCDLGEGAPFDAELMPLASSWGRFVYLDEKAALVRSGGSW